MSGGPVVLGMRGVGVARGGRRLFAGFDLELRAGQVAVVLGPNGAGKSSLLQAVAGFLPHDGSLTLSGRAAAELSRRQRARLAAWMGALPAADFGLTVRQRLELACEGLNPEAGAVESAAEALDVAALLPRSLAGLSSGERQRVELAALMLRDAPLWLADEPTAHLDLRHQAACLRLLRARCDAGRALMVVLHDLNQARVMLRDGDRVVLMDDAGGVRVGGPALMDDMQALSAAFGVRLQRCHGLAPDFGA